MRGLLDAFARPHAHAVQGQIGLFATMLVANTGAHAYAAYDGVQQIRRSSVGAGHHHARDHFLLFLYRFKVMLCTGVYTQNFIMTSIGRKKIIYNISWEDPAIDHTVMHMKDDDVVLTISSAGCNVLDYLCQGPKKIIAVDMNGRSFTCLSSSSRASAA